MLLDADATYASIARAEELGTGPVSHAMGGNTGAKGRKVIRDGVLTICRLADLDPPRGDSP